MMAMRGIPGKAFSDTQFLDDASEVLISCRQTLKWTYAHAFYLRDREKELFEYLQEDLEKSTEALSAELEKNIADIERMKLLTLSKTAETRKEHLLEGSAEGLTFNA